MSLSTREIRKQFIEFFEQREHTFVPSSSLLPADDPTLLFTNAGMNQFKDIFLGTAKRDYVRAANTQKCIRAGGKHNDLEDVGHDTYHHTFFEMLGNWSFGDYFKKEAIQWAWELLTEVWKLPKDRLYVTVFEGDKKDNLEPDTEASDLWKELTDVDPSHIILGNKKDNFWEMGETGPCGPCSEIHIDLTDDKSGKELVNADDARVIEIWNLVFIQYNRDASGKLSPLPAKHVDTGMGLERIAMVMQGKKSNYATDLFVEIIKKIESLTDHRYGADSGLDDRFDVATDKNPGDVACRVIADHARSLTFAIADGIIPSNDGRGYVIRRILRRAARYGRQYLNIEGPFLVKLVDTIVDLMGDMFPEIKQRQDYIKETITEEETSFGRTLDRGIALFNKQADKVKKEGKDKLPGEVVFDLYTTYGFPVDLTQIMADEVEIKVDIDGYDSAMARHRELSSGDKGPATEAISNLPSCDDTAKYSMDSIEAAVTGWVEENKFLTEGVLSTGDEAMIVLDRTNFYGESGGQIGDAGHLVWDGGKFAVRNTKIAGDCVLHSGVVEEGELHIGQTVRCDVDPSRLDTMRNHTATHLLNWGLRKVLGDHVNQAGSVVSPDRLRFDFSHNQAVTAEQLAEVEKIVNAKIQQNDTVSIHELALEQAQKIDGVRAMFGEKYGQTVRVIVIGSDVIPTAADENLAIEFCGGTHMTQTGGIGLFRIVSEESVAKGVRRISAVTGGRAVELMQANDAILSELSGILKIPAAEISQRVTAMQKEIKQLRKRPAAGGVAAGPEIIGEAESAEGKVIVGKFPTGDVAAMRNYCDQQRQKGAAAIFVGGAAEGKVMLVAMVSDELVKASSVKAGDWVKNTAPVVGGGGGGKPTMAQAGGKDPSKLDDALKAALDWAKKQLG